MKTIFFDSIPAYVRTVCRHLQANAHQAYIVGGALRDLSMGKVPKDYDIATDAVPDRVEELFSRTVPTGKQFGTITVITDDGGTLEITSFRKEIRFAAGQRSADIVYTDRLIDDLARRDFTVNAIAYDPVADRIEDPFHGLRDIEARTLQTVGTASERIMEDALRMMRAIRIQAEKDLEITPVLGEAIRRHACLIQKASPERITGELSRIITSPRPTEGVYNLLRLDILPWILPELSDCAGIPQREDYHQYDVFGHIAHALAYTEPELTIRLAVLLHDIGKAVSAQTDADGIIHFYGHEITGAEMAASILQRMKFSNEIQQNVIPLIRHHMRNINSDKALRRMMSELKTPEQALRFARIRFADKMAGRHDTATVAAQYRNTLDRIHAVLAQKTPLQVADLAINGREIAGILGIPPGPTIGRILQILLRRVLAHPELNDHSALAKAIPNIYAQLERERS